MILHSDLIQCATDLVTGKESPLIEMVAVSGGTETTTDPLLAEVRESAGAYLMAAFGQASQPDGQ